VGCDASHARHQPSAYRLAHASRCSLLGSISCHFAPSFQSRRRRLARNGRSGAKRRLASAPERLSCQKGDHSRDASTRLHARSVRVVHSAVCRRRPRRRRRRLRRSGELEKLVAPIRALPDPLVAQICRIHPSRAGSGAAGAGGRRRPEEAEASQWTSSVRRSCRSRPCQDDERQARMDDEPRTGRRRESIRGHGAIQTVRRQAQTAGNLKSNDKQVVVSRGRDVTTIVIQPASPQVIYVRSTIRWRSSPRRPVLLRLRGRAPTGIRSS